MPNVMAPSVQRAKFGWRPLPRSNAAKTRDPLKLAGVPQINETISAASGPKFIILSGREQEILLQKYYYFNTTNIFTLTFRFLSETFIRRSLFNFSSGSCHDSDATWQEIGRTCYSACSSPRPGSRTAVRLSEYVLILLFNKFFSR